MFRAIQDIMGCPVALRASGFLLDEGAAWQEFTSDAGECRLTWDDNTCWLAMDWDDEISCWGRVVHWSYR